jgi:His/Glu/Gln/Arg/opine family amino acid ABC transporter permease subunit
MLEFLSYGATGYGDELLNGLSLTLSLAIGGYLLAVVLGILLSFVAMSKRRIVRAVWRVYRSIMMGVPSLLVIFFLFFNLPILFEMLTGTSLDVTPLMAGVLALMLVYAAYVGETVRGAILNIPSGQFEAGKALGVKTIPLWKDIIFPQALRLALPGLSNIWMIVLKDTALVSLVGMNDLVRAANVAAGSTQKPFLFYSAALAAFLIVAAFSHVLIEKTEHHFSLKRRAAKTV